MEIGGYDIIIPGNWEEKDLNKIISLTRNIWPNLIFEIEKDEILHIFIYADQFAEKVWNESGRTDAFADSMIYVILDPKKDLTFVIDRVGSEIAIFIMKNIIPEMRKNGIEKTN